MESIANSRKVFEEYEVECNECQRYWTDQCDGVKLDSTKSCNSFIATRKMDIPMKLKSLEHRLETLGGCVIVLNVIFIFHLLTHILEALGK